MMLCKILLLIVVSSVPSGFLIAQETQRTLTNADVVEMFKSGIGEQTIILMIQKGQTKFDTSPEAIIELKKAGVADSVLNAMLNASSPTNPPIKNTLETCRPLFDKTLDAIGSRGNIAAVKSVRLIGTSNVTGPSGSASYQIERVRVLPASTYAYGLNANGVSTRLVITPEFNYIAAGKMTSAVPANMLDDQRSSMRIEPLYVAHYRDDYACSSEGSEQIGNLTTAKIKISGQGAEGYWSIDPATGRLSRISYSSAAGQSVTDLSDWRLVDGILVAFKRHISQASTTTDVVISEYQLNPATDAKLFDRPAQQPAAAFTFKVLQSESVPYVVQTGGGVSTNCNISGSTSTSMSATTYGNITSGEATSTPNLRMNCNSSDNTIRWPHVLNAMFVVASDGNAYIIACDRAWRWSKCTPLRVGDTFMASRNDKGFVVQKLNSKNKETEATYSVLQAKSLQ
jgi:hypothetical protein